MFSLVVTMELCSSNSSTMNGLDTLGTTNLSGRDLDS